MKNINDLLAEVSKKDKFTDKQLISYELSSERRRKRFSYDETKEMYDYFRNIDSSIVRVAAHFKTSIYQIKRAFQEHSFVEDMTVVIKEKQAASARSVMIGTSWSKNSTVIEKKKDIKDGMSVDDFVEKWLNTYKNKDSCLQFYYQKRKKLFPELCFERNHKKSLSEAHNALFELRNIEEKIADLKSGMKTRDFYEKWKDSYSSITSCRTSVCGLKKKYLSK